MTGTAEPRPSGLLFALRLLGLVGLFIAYVPPHIASRRLLGRSSWPPRFLRHAALVCGMQPRIEGQPLRPHTLAIANHTSWIDILLLGGWTGAAFVSKAELQKTPLLGWIARQNRTIYIDRAQRRESHEQVRRIRSALERPQPLVIFPEGTTGSGRQLLAFRSTLLKAVASPPDGVSVRPVAIDYGEAADIVGWHSGEAGMANFKRVLGRRGSTRVTIRLLEPLQATGDRKAMAREARQSIGAALSSLAGPDTL